MPRISADILGPLCHGYKNRANCHEYLRISRVNATDTSLWSMSLALTRDIRRYPWHWHDFCIEAVWCACSKVCSIRLVRLVISSTDSWSCWMSSMLFLSSSTRRSSLSSILSTLRSYASRRSRMERQ